MNMCSFQFWQVSFIFFAVYIKSAKNILRLLFRLRASCPSDETFFGHHGDWPDTQKHKGKSLLLDTHAAAAVVDLSIPSPSLIPIWKYSKPSTVFLRHPFLSLFLPSIAFFFFFFYNPGAVALPLSCTQSPRKKDGELMWFAPSSSCSSDTGWESGWGEK